MIIEKIIYIAYVIGFSRFFIVLADIIFDLYFVSSSKNSNKAFRKELVNLIKQVIKAIIIIIAFLLFLRKMDVDITGFVASLGLGGLMIAMASKDTISNFFGSLKIIFDESFSQGDWIKVGDTEGTVVELGFISTKIRTFDNALISLPNAKLANESVKNWSKRKVGRRIKMHIGVTYDAKREDLLKAVDEIRQMLIDHPEIATESKVGVIGRRKSLIESSDLLGVKSTLLVHVDSYGDSSINILIYAFSKTTNWSSWLEVKEDIMMKIWEILEKNDLEMAFPTQTIHLKNDTKGEE
jgi:MscS family membrane protein